MSPRGFDPTCLDVEAFAVEGAELSGSWPLADFDRVGESAMADAAPGDADRVAWRARGRRVAGRGGEFSTWLDLDAEATISLQCQRCLAAVRVPLAVDRKFSFVSGEDAAAAIDASSEDDVLAMTRALDLRELIEDELLLAMPLVPRHAICPEPLPVTDDDPVEERPNPFAALAGWKRDGPPG